MKSPILFITFNRYHETILVFNKIKNYKPYKLYLSSDGPKLNKLGDYDTITNIREFLLKNVNWECEVLTLFNDINLGCNTAVTNAIDWFFENEDQGIILEDDCLPSDSFFSFCNNLLDKYKNDFRISGISGTNFKTFNDNFIHSYFFSDILSVWGWATWKRSWDLHRKKYDSLNLDFKFISNHDKIINQSIYEYANYPHTTWDYKMWLTFYSNNMIAIVPYENLVKNIGFSTDATIFNKNIKKNILKFQRNENEISINLIHPIIFKTNYDYDNFMYVKQLNYKRFNKKKFILKYFGIRFYNLIKSIQNIFE